MNCNSNVWKYCVLSNSNTTAQETVHLYMNMPIGDILNIVYNTNNDLLGHLGKQAPER